MLEFPSVIGHLYRSNGELCAFVADATACAIQGLLMRIDREDTVDNGHIFGGVEVRQTLGCPLADVVEVRRVATDDTAQNDDSIDMAIVHHLRRAKDEFKTTGDLTHMDTAVFGPILSERSDCALE